MVTVYYKSRGNIFKTEGDQLKKLSLKDVIWIDLYAASPEETKAVENFTGTNLQSKQQAEEIEISSKYIEYNNLIFINSNFLTIFNGQHKNEIVSFIIKEGMLVSSRNADLKTFAETVRKFKANPFAFSSGYSFLISLLETRVDMDADMLESISREITEISKTLSRGEDLNKNMLLRINGFQETTMVLRENIIDKQRIISAMLRSDQFPKDFTEKLRILIKDIASLLDHSAFSFERLEYLQNTFLGLVNLEQNKIIKIFTVVSVIFMPPTLIASIYGMNFKSIPEINWAAGYPFALLLMILSSVGTLFFFKRKNWL
ncbi:MAG: magnesium/cobalt transporter CorA [Cytophagaceae bacterium]|nr:magnesium/cobalt transporter CorA [Cytophagaceae bacterium]